MIISSAGTGAAPLFNGRSFLNDPMEHCIGFRVVGFSIRPNTNGPITWTGGLLWALLSYQLGALRAEIPYQLALNTVTPYNAQLNPQQRIIGLRSEGQTNGNNLASTMPFADLNQDAFFKTPIRIESFDWEIVPVGGAFTVPALCIYQIEIIIEFIPQCQC